MKMDLFDEIVKAIEEEVDKCGPTYMQKKMMNAFRRYVKNLNGWQNAEKDIEKWEKEIGDYLRTGEWGDSYISDIRNLTKTRNDYSKSIDDFNKRAEPLMKYIEQGYLTENDIETWKSDTGFTKYVKGLVEWNKNNRKGYTSNKEDLMKALEKNDKNAMEVNYIKRTDKGWVANIKGIDKEIPIIIDGTGEISERIED